jgi:hypothetical protein
MASLLPLLFAGAADTVSGSRHIVQYGDQRAGAAGRTLEFNLLMREFEKWLAIYRTSGE